MLHSETKHLHGRIAADKGLNRGGAGSAHSSLLLHKSQRGHRDLHPAFASNKNGKTSSVKEAAITSGISSLLLSLVDKQCHLCLA